MDVLPLSFFSTPRLVLVLSSNFFCSYTNFTEQTLYVYIHSYIIVVSIVTPWTVVRQASLSFIVSEFAQTHVHPTISSSVIPFSFYLQSFPASGSFPTSQLFVIRWPKYWSFSISPRSEYSGLISLRIDWFDLLVVQGTLEMSLLQHHSSVQFSSVAQSYPTPCDPMNRSTPGLPIHHQLQEFTQSHVYRVGDAIQPSHPLSSPSPPALNLSQHQGLFK